MQLTHIRDLLVETPLSSGHAFLSAASGMVVQGDLLCAVADDEHCLAMFALGTAEPGKLVRLIDDDLPKSAAQRKKVKPDFEILLALPGANLPGANLPRAGGNRLLALGSGSTPQRMRGAIIDLPANDSKDGKDGKDGKPRVRLIDLQPLFAAIAPLVSEVNLEGAVLNGDQLLLFNRGNMQFPASHILAIPLAAVLDGGPMVASVCAALKLPMVSGVPLTVTDACRLNNGHILLCAVAEATADSYADGALMGAAIVELDAQFNLLAVEPLEPPLKVEGIATRLTDEGVHLLCVTDADDPSCAAGLYMGLHKRSGEGQLTSKPTPNAA